MLRNLIVILTLLLVATLPFVTKEYDSDDPAGVRIVHDIPYADGSKDPRQQLDLYLPRVKPEEKLPLVVWIHGGAWKFGSKDDGPAIELDLADHGFAVAAINYRYSTAAIYPAQIHDCKAAIRWLRAHAAEYSYDATKVGVWGASAGGHLAAMLGTTGGIASLEGNEGNPDQSSAVQAVADWCGPTDLTTFNQEAMQPRFRDSKPELFVNTLLGGPPEKSPELAKSASPVFFVTKDDPPFLILHSIEDPVVPFEQSNDFAKKLETEGVKVRFMKINGDDHIPMEKANFDALYNFFDEHLKSHPLLPKP